MIPRNEYPRPRLVRKEWECLNGEWQFEIDNGNSGKERGFYERNSLNGRIIVPFCPESELSGVGNTDFMCSVWYRRAFSADLNKLKGKRLILHFGAVDYFTEVWINGVSIGTHKGGYTPFSFDITDKLKDGENVITLNAFDDTRDSLQPSGKQCYAYYNKGCHYTRTTGIWQTVWLETVDDIYVEKLKLTPDVDNGKVYIELYLNREGASSAHCEASFGSRKHIANFRITGCQATAYIDIPEDKLWSIEEPNLYDLSVKLDTGDEFTSYFGMRKVEINGFAVEINGKAVFQRLVLDQGFYPDGIYTAPTDEALKKDIELSMAAGFNGARLHMKVFEPRTSYWADKLGYILWGEYPNWGVDFNKPESLLSVMNEWVEAVERDYGSPAIIGWCPFNEVWDKNLRRDVFETVYNVTKAIDKTRPVIDSSGGLHVVTDVFDFHDYEQNPEVFAAKYAPFAEDDSKAPKFNESYERYDGQPYFVSEFGGTWWNIDDDGQKGWGYGKSPEDLEEFYKRYDGLAKALLNHPKICAFCYTQLTDVFQERNGIYSFARRAKFDVTRIKASNQRKAAIEK